MRIVKLMVIICYTFSMHCMHQKNLRNVSTKIPPVASVLDATGIHNKPVKATGTAVATATTDTAHSSQHGNTQPIPEIPRAIAELFLEGHQYGQEHFLNDSAYLGCPVVAMNIVTSSGIVVTTVAVLIK